MNVFNADRNFGNMGYNSDGAIDKLIWYLQSQSQTELKYQRRTDINEGNMLSPAALQALDNNLNNNFLTVVRTPSANNYDNLAAVVRTFTHDMDDIIILELLSTALTMPRTYLKVLERRGHFLIVTAGGDPRIALWLTALTMYLQKDNASLVARLSHAITQSQPGLMVWTTEELQAIQDYKLTTQRDSVKLEINTTLRTSIFRPVDYNDIMRRIKDNISDYTARLSNLYTELKQVVMKEYYAKYALKNADDPFEEVIDYLTSTRIDNIAKLERRDNSSIYLITKTPLTFSEDIGNYIQGARSSGHPLYRNPQLTRLIQDIGESKVRLPIYATFRIGHNFTNSGNVIGTSGVSGIPPGAVSNPHINDADCFSEAKSKLVDYAYQDNMIGYFEQLFYTGSSVNPYDGAIMPSVVDQIKDLNSQAILSYRTPEGWVTMTKGEYYAHTQATAEQTT